jgi:hypothetical protein
VAYRREEIYLWRRQSSGICQVDICQLLLLTSIQDQAYNNAKPFGCPLIFEIIQSQWFRNSSGSKPDYDAAMRMIKEKEVPIHLILSVVCAVRPLPLFYSSFLF